MNTQATIRNTSRWTSSRETGACLLCTLVAALRDRPRLRPTLKALINEEFGDSVWSATDFTMEVEQEPAPKGDRVKITMSGKFLPYKRF